MILRLFPLLIASCLSILPALLALPAAAAGMTTLKPAIMVNDKVISALEMEMRIKLALVSAGLQESDEARAFLTRQVEQALIDEELQVQEAKRLGITSSAEEEAVTFRQIARSNGLDAPALRQRLEGAGILPAYLMDQIRAGLLWQAVLRSEVMPQVIVTDEDVDEAVRSIEARQGEPQRLLAEIFLPIDSSADTGEVVATAEEVIEQMRRGSGFQAMARQVSQAPTASVGGDMGWVEAGSLPQEVEEALTKIEVGRLTPPIVTPYGVYIMLLRDERPMPERKITVSVKMLTFPVRNFENRSQVNRAAGRAAEAQKALTSCEAAPAVARRFSAQVKLLPEEFEVSRMPGNLRSVTMGLPIGQASEPFRAPEGIGLAIVCARTDSGIDRELVRQRLMSEQVDRRSRRYLQDLRSLATIEMRN